MVRKRKKSVLSKVVDFFLKSDFEAYLVGGIIRDTLLGRKTHDIDISVHGDAIKAATELNKIIRGKLEIHKDFGTATILKNRTRIDIAMTRDEIYPKPGALPQVFESDIHGDLRRRDFSINAMALALNRKKLRFLDPFFGMKYLNERLIRVIHPKSFLDDPTRIFRALRYKNRLNFKLESKTEKLLIEAVWLRVLKKVSKQRILNELKLICKEKTYLKTLKDLHHYEIFEFNMKKLNLIKKIPDDLKCYYFLSLLEDKFPLSNEEERIVSNFRNLERIRNTLKSAKINSDIYYALHNVDERVIKVLNRLYKGLRQKIRKFYRLRRIKPIIRGDDLLALSIKPGPIFREILSGIHKMQLDGLVKSKHDATQIIKKWLNVS
ncbi:MAG: hypothetical protein N3A65_06240 [candidate division WOR-3 bacterium]|nr:hypothetical protein [candidate division WOR-3 bacterium]